MNVRKSVEIANLLRKDILLGKYGSEGGLPETRELAHRNGVAVNTIVAALSNLEGQGLITKRGHSFYVNSVSFVMTSYVPPVHMRPSQYSRNLGNVARVPLPAHLAEKLHLQSDLPTVYRAQLQGSNGGQIKHPYKLSYHWYVLPVSDEQLARMESDPMYDEVMHQNTPLQMRCHDEVTPRLLTAEEAALFGVPASTPVNSLLVTISDLSGTLLLVQELVLNAHVTLIYDYVFENKPS